MAGAPNMRTEMVLDAIEMAVAPRHDLAGPAMSHRRRVAVTSIRYGERLAEIGAVPSIGSVGDSYDNALAESVNALYKTELIRGPGHGPWRTVEDVELATLGWVHWHNTERLHGSSRRAPAIRSSVLRAQQAPCSSQPDDRGQRVRPGPTGCIGAAIHAPHPRCRPGPQADAPAPAIAQATAAAPPTE